MTYWSLTSFLKYLLIINYCSLKIVPIYNFAFDKILLHLLESQEQDISSSHSAKCYSVKVIEQKGQEENISESKKCCEKRHCHCEIVKETKKMALKDLKSPSMEYALELGKQILKSPLNSPKNSPNSPKKQHIGKLNTGKSLDVVDSICNSKTKKAILTSHKSIDLQVPQETRTPTERRHSLGLNVLLPNKKRCSLKRSKSTFDIEDEEAIINKETNNTKEIMENLHDGKS